ncbi:MAG: hypothetical protein ISS80_01900 [Candidatus Cloacimonetes bacterium]|nr:hypothetical protein [Candidatus Cloacimonadota bacterium]MBL7148804.1 hypothetical protein [Candidatus Cloacimonadota bacterium]
MKYILLVLLSIVVISNSAFADDRETVFEGLGAKIVTVVDDMTDEKSGVIFLDFGSIYMAVYGYNDYAIWANTDDLNFAFDETHLIRVGENEPFTLKSLIKRNCLKPTNAVEAEAVIKSLARGEEIKLRYYNWPQHEKIDKKLQNLNFGFIYNKAVNLFGWKDFGISTELAPVKLNIYIPTDIGSEGYVSITVEGNSDLGLGKNFDQFGGGTTINVGVKSGFGFNKGHWICGSVELSGNKHLIIRDSNGIIVFKEVLPTSYICAPAGERWPSGEIAAKKAWEASPLGSIEIEGSFGKRVMLYGFRELWKWGVENSVFPSLE